MLLLRWQALNREDHFSQENTFLQVPSEGKACKIAMVEAHKKFRDATSEGGTLTAWQYSLAALRTDVNDTVSPYHCCFGPIPATSIEFGDAAMLMQWHLDVFRSVETRLRNFFRSVEI